MLSSLGQGGATVSRLTIASLCLIMFFLLPAPRPQPCQGFILLPIAKEHCSGGEASNAALTEALQQALRPFLKKPEEGGSADEAGQAAGPSNSNDCGPSSLSAAAGSGAPLRLFAGTSVYVMRDV